MIAMTKKGKNTPIVAVVLFVGIVRRGAAYLIVTENRTETKMSWLMTLKVRDILYL
jgi:hypothetical protein